MSPGVVGVWRLIILRKLFWFSFEFPNDEFFYQVVPGGGGKMSPAIYLGCGVSVGLGHRDGSFGGFS